jgi:hypothetical protein
MRAFARESAPNVDTIICSYLAVITNKSQQLKAVQLTVKFEFSTVTAAVLSPSGFHMHSKVDAFAVIATLVCFRSEHQGRYERQGR